MGIIGDVGIALRVISRGSFWAGLGRALLTWPILATVAVLAGACAVLFSPPYTAAQAGSWSLAPLLIACLALFMLAPLLLHAWCPLAARAAASAMQREFPEVPMPSFAVFFLRWLLVGLVFFMVVKGAIYIPRPLYWLAWLPVLMAVGWLHMCCALCVHAGAAEADAVGAATLLRRSLLWPVLCYLPGVLIAAVVLWSVQATGLRLSNELWIPIFFGLWLLIGMLSLALTLPLWAALALRELALQRP